MKESPDIAALSALIGDPARANMLMALMSGLALTAGELAREAGVSAQTASAHLAQLREAALIVVEVQGRHRYHRLAGPDVAEALEGLMGLASRLGRLRTRPGPRDDALREARVCYDHLAGEMGVRLFEALVRQGSITMKPQGLAISENGRQRFAAEGLDVAKLESGNRPVCRACLDWSERRSHLAGALGSALLMHFLTRNWAKRQEKGRAILFTPEGMRRFERFCDTGPTPAEAAQNPPIRRTSAHSSSVTG
ncbi:MAG: ArsR/SmtB family transcription factor [Beijerinckiaceae bacterium]